MDTRQRNSFFVSIREGHPQSCDTDTNEDENIYSPILNIEALRTIGHIVRAVKDRIQRESPEGK